MRTGTIVGAAGLLLLLGLAAAPAAADEEPRERVWALGWDDALTLRRQLGPWHVSVQAGPNDYLREQTEAVYRPDWPDSLQGRRGDEDGYRRESGFVRLEVGRRVAAHRTFALAATAGAGYAWSDEKWEDHWLNSGAVEEGDPQPYRSSVREIFDSSWRASLGLRLAWRPVPFVGLELAYGLVYTWSTIEETAWAREAREIEWSRTVSRDDRKTFDEYGFYQITDLAVMVWF